MRSDDPAWAELSEGTRIEIEPDPSDPRFDLVRFRVPARAAGEDAGLPTKVEGNPACEWLTVYYLRQGAQVLEVLHVHAVATTVRAIATALGVIQDARRASRAAAERRCDS
jgi:hypothetical protein